MVSSANNNNHKECAFSSLRTLQALLEKKLKRHKKKLFGQLRQSEREGTSHNIFHVPIPTIRRRRRFRQKEKALLTSQRILYMFIHFGSTQPAKKNFADGEIKKSGLLVSRKETVHCSINGGSHMPVK